MSFQVNLENVVVASNNDRFRVIFWLVFAFIVLLVLIGRISRSGYIHLPTRWQIILEKINLFIGLILLATFLYAIYFSLFIGFPE